MNKKILNIKENEPKTQVIKGFNIMVCFTQPLSASALAFWKSPKGTLCKVGLCATGILTLTIGGLALTGFLLPHSAIGIFIIPLTGSFGLKVLVISSSVSFGVIASSLVVLYLKSRHKEQSVAPLNGTVAKVFDSSSEAPVVPAGIEVIDPPRRDFSLYPWYECLRTQFTERVSYARKQEAEQDSLFLGAEIKTSDEMCSDLWEYIPSHENLPKDKAWWVLKFDARSAQGGTTEGESDLKMALLCAYGTIRPSVRLFVNGSFSYLAFEFSSKKQLDEAIDAFKMGHLFDIFLETFKGLMNSNQNIGTVALRNPGFAEGDNSIKIKIIKSSEQFTLELPPCHTVDMKVRWEEGRKDLEKPGYKGDEHNPAYHYEERTKKIWQLNLEDLDFNFSSNPLVLKYDPDRCGYNLTLPLKAFPDSKGTRPRHK